MNTTVDRLGECRVSSPLTEAVFVPDDAKVLYDTCPDKVKRQCEEGGMLAFERAGPREKLFFEPSKFRAGIVTCGGLCPGLNDVIRGLALELAERYGAPPPVGFRYGYQGLTPSYGHEPLELTPEVVEDIHNHGGTILSSSRGNQDIGTMVDTLERMGLQALFTLGGDGTQRAAALIADEARRRNLNIAVVGLPKTIDNDLVCISQSFGFTTAVAMARPVIESAVVEARGAPNGIGIVKLMGRSSGWIAAYATLAVGDVDFCLVPECRFLMEGPDGLLNSVHACLLEKRHCVIVVAEGAGQDLTPGEPDRDPSGNLKLKDIGAFVRDELSAYFATEGVAVTMKYIDPSYTIRSVRADPADAVFCLQLAQNAVHAAMAGRTNMLTGFWNGRFTHVPFKLITTERNYIDPKGPLWQAVLATTAQPATMGYDSE